MKFDASKLPNGTLMLIGVSYGNAQPGGETRGRTSPKVYTYALLKAGGLWYMSGTGQVPQAAGWGAVERWLAKDGRKLEWVKAMHENDLPTLWQAAEAIEGTRSIAGGRDERDQDDLNTRSEGADQ